MQYPARIDLVDRNTVVRAIAACQQCDALAVEREIVAQIDIVDLRDNDTLDLLPRQIVNSE